MAVVQGITSIISKFVQQSHILQQFLLSVVTHTKTLEDVLVDFMGKFNIVGSFASGRILFREFLQNLGQGVILGGTVDTLSKNLFSIEKDTFDEFTSVLSCNILVSNSYEFGVQQCSPAARSGTEAEAGIGKASFHLLSGGNFCNIWPGILDM